MTLNLSQFSLKDGFKGTPPSRPPKAPKVSNLRGATAPFIKGPIPLAWMMAAAMLPGKSLHVGLVLWYLAGLKKTKTFALAIASSKDLAWTARRRGAASSLWSALGSSPS